MTYIATPAIADSEVLNHVARDMVIVQDGQPMLKRRVKVVTESGVVHELSFAQMDGLLNILDTSREIETITPLQYLVQHYKLDDLVELGKDNWVVPEYMIMVTAGPKTVRFEGRLTRNGSVDKEFKFALGGFDFVQQLSLSRCIGQLKPEFEQVIGTFDLSYTFTSGPDGMKVYTGEG